MLSTTIRKNIVQDYLNEKIGTVKIAKRYNTSSNTVLRILRENNVPTPKNGDAVRKYSVDIDFFKNIDTENKAYWLGFIAADGHVNNEKKRKLLSITLSTVDINHLTKFKNCIKLDSELKISPSKSGGKILSDKFLCTLIIYNQNITADLQNKGIERDKTFNIDFNKIINNIPDDLKRHFIRGFFDGDGGWFIDNKRKTIRCGFCSGSERFLTDLNEFLHQDCNIHIKRIKNKKNTNGYDLMFCGSRACGKLFNYMYRDANVFLERKYDKSILYFRNINLIPNKYSNNWLDPEYLSEKLGKRGKSNRNSLNSKS